jgi:hypothetical protein
MQKHCVVGMGTLPICADNRLKIDEFTAFLTFDFVTSSTVTISGTEHASGTLFVPSGCFEDTACAEVPSKFNVPGFSATCLDVEGGCDCAASIDTDDLSFSATYQVDGTEFVVYQGIETIVGRYCIEGDSLWMRFKRFDTIDYTYELTRKR